jgi:hypothetical protein
MIPQISKQMAVEFFKNSCQNSDKKSKSIGIKFLGKMHAVPSSLKGKYVIRYTVTSPRTTLNDIARDWEIIQQFSTEVLAGDMEVVSTTSTTRTRMPLKGYSLSMSALRIMSFLQGIK